MSTIFPFGFPPSTALYLALYVVTLAVHAVFMNYVLAGSAVVAADALARLFWRGRAPSVAAAVLRDWMPFALSVAITAGVAPLLFVQVLYKQGFYTANLLLFHRWMAILPALIVGFYLVYLLKTEWLARRRDAVGAVVATGALACFAFTGYSWTENHLLSVQPSAWAGFYGSGAMAHGAPDLLPRIATWALGGFPTLAAILGWQLQGRTDIDARSVRRLCALALAGLALAAGSGALHYQVLDDRLREVHFGPLAGPYLVAASLGLALQGVAWAAQARTGLLGTRWLAAASAGCLVTILGMSVVREGLRLTRIDLGPLFAQHEHAAAVGGLPVFLFFLAVNAALIAWAIVRVRRDLAR